MLEEVDLGKYPFLEEARLYAKECGLNITDLALPDFLPVRKRAINRINSCVDNTEYAPGEFREEYFSFICCNIYLRIINSQTLMKRFSLAESLRIEKYLLEDLQRKRDVPNKLYKSIFKIDVKTDGGEYLIPIPQYLKEAVNFNSVHWKLVNRKVNAGNVYLKLHSFVRVIRNSISNMIFNKIKSINVEGIPKIFREETSMIHLPPETKLIHSTSIPPCIRALVKDFEEGKNISHNGRILFASFMFERGKEIDDLIPYFEKLPDYNERITKYQLGFLKNKGYKCSGCEKVSTEGLCFKDESCAGIFNPVNYT